MKNATLSEYSESNQTQEPPIVKRTTSKTHGPETLGTDKNQENIVLKN